METERPLKATMSIPHKTSRESWQHSKSIGIAIFNIEKNRKYLAEYGSLRIADGERAVDALDGGRDARVQRSAGGIAPDVA